MSVNNIYNFKQVNEQILTGGQPSEAQLQALRELASEQQALRDLTQRLTEEARKHEHR